MFGNLLDQARPCSARIRSPDFPRPCPRARTAPGGGGAADRVPQSGAQDRPENGCSVPTNPASGNPEGSSGCSPTCEYGGVNDVVGLRPRLRVWPAHRDGPGELVGGGDLVSTRCLDCHKLLPSGSRCGMCAIAHRAKRETNGWERQQQTARILDRDGHQCVFEGPQNGRLEVDHIVPLHRGGSNEDSNLRTLCAEHHRQATGEARRSRPGYSR